MKEISKYYLGSEIFSEELIEAVEAFKVSDRDSGKMLLRRLYKNSTYKVYITDRNTLDELATMVRGCAKDSIVLVRYCNPSKNDAIAYIKSMEFVKDKRSKNRYRMFADIIVLNSDIIKHRKDLDKYYIYPRVTLLESNRRVVDDIYGFDIKLKSTGEVK